MDRTQTNPENGAVPQRRFYLCRQLANIGMFLAAMSLACNFLTGWIGNQAGLPGTINEETFNRLEISTGKSGQAQPGDRLELQVGTTECCYVFQPVKVKTRWSVDPPTGAKINTSTGVLEIATDVPSGTTYTVTADIQNGRKRLTAQIKIYTLQANPLVGVWRESKQIDCKTGTTNELQGDSSLRELVFKADGTFQATFTPFEIYHDYWGNYTFDPGKSTLDLKVVSGNYTPENLDLQGEYQIDENGALVLKNIWLGRRDPGALAGCGHTFIK
jgi:hypothetical protein